jgi:hypothetical protein
MNLLASLPVPVTDCRMVHDLSSINPATVLPHLPPFFLKLLRSNQSASAARAQSPGVDRLRPGAGRLTLADV